MSNSPTFQIPQDVITPIIQANISEAVAKALGPQAHILEKAIAGILSTPVDSSGKPTQSSYNQAGTWLDWTVGNALRQAAMNAITEQADMLRDSIKAHLVAELKKKNSPLIKQLVDGLVGAAFSPDNMKYRLTITAKAD